MASIARPKLAIPAVLTVSVLTLGCPAGDDSDTGNESGPNTTAATEATASETGTTAGTAVDTGSTTGEVPDCAGLDETMCNANLSCVWEGTEIGCLVICGIIEDQATCESIDYCEWFEDACYSTI